MFSNDSTQPTLPWHQSLWQRFFTSYRNEKLPHAILLAGSHGLGQEQFAERVTQGLLCEQDDAPCGHCSGCHLYAAGNHPDYYRLSPEEKGKQIKVDSVRSLSKNLAQTAQQGGYKIVLITPAEALNIAASNALLKTLEEPQGKTIIILVASDVRKISATLRSRCQVYTFTSPTSEEIANWSDPVSRQAGWDKWLALSENLPLKAKQYAENPNLQQEYQQFMSNLCDFAQAKQVNNMVDCCTELSKNFGVEQVLDWLQLYFHDLQSLKFNSNGDIHHLAYKNELLQHRQQLNNVDWFEIFEQLTGLKRLVTRHSNLNEKLIWMDFWINTGDKYANKNC